MEPYCEKGHYNSHAEDREWGQNGHVSFLFVCSIYRRVSRNRAAICETVQFFLIGWISNVNINGFVLFWGDFIFLVYLCCFLGVLE